MGAWGPGENPGQDERFTDEALAAAERRYEENQRDQALKTLGITEEQLDKVKQDWVTKAAQSTMRRDMEGAVDKGDGSWINGKNPMPSSLNSALDSLFGIGKWREVTASGYPERERAVANIIERMDLSTSLSTWNQIQTALDAAYEAGHDAGRA